MDARQQPPLAPLDLLAAIASGVNRPRSTPPSASTAASAASTSTGRDVERARERRGGGRADQPEPRPHDLDQRAVPIGPRRGAPRRRLDQVGLEARLRPDRGGQRAPLGRRPRRRGSPWRSRAARPAAISSSQIRRSTRRPSRSGSAPRSSSRSCSSSASRRSGQASSTTAAIAAGSRPPDVVGHGRGQAAAQRDRARAALLERRVVEEGVGVGVQDLVREHRRLGRLAGHAPDLPVVQRGRARRAGPSTSIASVRQSRIVSRTSG